MLEYPSPPSALNSMPISESTMNGNSAAGAAAAAAAAASFLADAQPVGDTSASSSAVATSAPSSTQLPQALQNLQRLLQTQLANVNPLHLQQALQRQQQLQMADNGRKQLEQMMHSLQEQLQINLLQQTHLGSGPGKPSVSAMQQLQQQQQQLVAQMQMTQQAIMMGNSMESGGKDRSSAHALGAGRERHMSETFGSTGSSDGSMKENRPDNNGKVELNGRERHSSGVGGVAGKRESPSSSPSGGGAGGGGGGNSFSSSSSGHSSAPTEKLFSHGHCHWPGCDASCGDLSQFHRHLSEAHVPDDKSTAQARVQAQIVSQLELQLNKERDRLGAMMRHLNLEMRAGEVREKREPPPTLLQPNNHSSPLSVYNSLDRERERRSPPMLPPPRSPSPKRFKRESPDHRSTPSFGLPTSLAAGLGPLQPRLGNPLSVVPPSLAAAAANLQQQQQQQSPLSALTAAVRSPLLSSAPATPIPSSASSPSPANSLGGIGPIRPRPSSALVEKASPVPLPLPHGFDERRGRGDRGNPNLDPEMDIKLNRDFYANNDVRPPYTYAALIRYAIRETSDQQLTLHEIYNWFTTTFMYFRRNAASWKNAVRHNLSLHKCFMRVENVKGAVWTVDDDEYHRRRPPRGVQSASSASASPTLTPQTPSLIDSNLSSMLAAASPEGRAAFFNQAALVEQMRRSGAFPDVKAMAAAAAAAAAAAVATTTASSSSNNHGSSGLESPPASLDNRSTPGSLDLSRVKTDAESPPPSLVPPPPSVLFKHESDDGAAKEGGADADLPGSPRDEDAAQRCADGGARSPPAGEDDDGDNVGGRVSVEKMDQGDSETCLGHDGADYSKVGREEEEEERIGLSPKDTTDQPNYDNQDE